MLKGGGTVRGSIQMLMAKSTKVTLLKIKEQARGSGHGLMAMFTKETMLKVK